MNKEKPYIITKKVIEERKYNPKYGDDRVCKCGHPYYRHFDTYEDMYPCGCKYCQCFEFEEKKPNKRNQDGTKTYIDKLGRTWIISKESLPKKRGSYKFYLAETADKTHSLRADLYKDVLTAIDEKVEKESIPYF